MVRAILRQRLARVAWEERGHEMWDMGNNMNRRSTYLLELVLLGLLVLAGLGCLAVELLRGKLGVVGMSVMSAHLGSGGERDGTEIVVEGSP
jgi:hypothetical protein